MLNAFETLRKVTSLLRVKMVYKLFIKPASASQLVSFYLITERCEVNRKTIREILAKHTHTHKTFTSMYLSSYSLHPPIHACTHTSLPLLSVFIVCLHTAVHDPAGGAVKHHAVSIQAVPAQPGHGAVFSHVAPGLHHVLLLAPQTHL